MAISQIEVRRLESQHTAVVRHRITMAEVGRIPDWIEKTMAAVERSGQHPAGPPFLRTLAMDAGGMEIEVGWPVPESFTGDREVTASRLPAGPAAVASYFGPYEGIAPAYEAIQSWCREHGREIAGPPWECYLTDPQAEPDQTRWRTDVMFPLAG